MDVQYSSSVKSGVISRRKNRRRETITVGVWIRRTVDRPLSQLLSGNPYNEQFPYTPLNVKEIRTLTLFPAHEHSPIRASIRHLSLEKSSSPAPYEALSYLWGQPNNQCEAIEIDGFPFLVGGNLALALRTLRHGTVPRVVWVDAVCINQIDAEEKSAQVRLMSKIYAEAEHVVVWLGLSTENTSVGMDILQEFAENKPFGKDAAWRTLPPDFVRAGLLDIVTRDWFQRFWTLQEAALARQIVMTCGPESITWQNKCPAVLKFLRGIKLAVISPQWTNAEEGLESVDMNPLIALLHTQLDTGPSSHIWKTIPRSNDLLDYAHSMRHRHATDMRDRIYALLGLAGASPKYAIEPDYTKSPEQVFDDFVELVSRQTQDLCNEFERLEAEQKPTAAHKKASLECLNTLKGSTDTARTIENFIDSICAQAKQEVRNNDHATAAQLLQQAAMFLRSESHRSNAHHTG